VTSLPSTRTHKDELKMAGRKEDGVQGGDPGSGGRAPTLSFVLGCGGSRVNRTEPEGIPSTEIRAPRSCLKLCSRSLLHKNGELVKRSREYIASLARTTAVHCITAHLCKRMVDIPGHTHSLANKRQFFFKFQN
jgi:hypothetical protein